MELFLIVICAVAAGASIILFAMWYHEHKRHVEDGRRIAHRETELTGQLQQTQNELKLLYEKHTTLRETNARLSAEIENLRDKREEEQKELEKLQASYRAEFKNMAAEMLEERTRQFKETNKEAMEHLLKPFDENIKAFKERINHIFTHTTERQSELKTELKRLMELNHRITEETSNLTSALKGNSKTQGDWGEAILERILESSNLRKGIHYTTQQSIKDEASKNRRPDVIIHMPDNKQIVVDSKVSLRDFVKYTEEENEEDRKRYLEAHQKAIRNHVNELGGKNYQSLLHSSPDFVIMFVASEPAFLTAMQGDNTIWSYAYERKVIIASPTNLFAMLKIVDDLWKRDTQSRNAIRIAEEGAKLYDKFVVFTETLLRMGKDLKATSTEYEHAMKQLSEGQGNLISRTEKMRLLGIKHAKTLPEKLRKGADYGEEETTQEGES